MNKGGTLARPPKPEFMSQTVYDKVGQCSVGIANEQELVNNCSACTCEIADANANSDKAVATTFDAFSAGKRLLGSPVQLDDGTFLGRISGLRPTASFLARAVSKIASEDEVEQNLRWLAHGSPDQRADAEFWYDRNLRVTHPPTGRGVLASPLPCWLFLRDAQDAADKLLASDDVSELPCRLGLPSLVDDMPRVPPLWFVGFVIPCNRVRNPRNPSVFDGGYKSVRDIWLPGGITQPLPWAGSQCVSAGGIHECVSEQPSFDEFDSSIFVFESREHP
jgi:hypothetical protein